MSARNVLIQILAPSLTMLLISGCATTAGQQIAKSESITIGKSIPCHKISYVKIEMGDRVEIKRFALTVFESKKVYCSE